LNLHRLLSRVGQSATWETPEHIERVYHSATRAKSSLDCHCPMGPHHSSVPSQSHFSRPSTSMTSQIAPQRHVCLWLWHAISGMGV